MPPKRLVNKRLVRREEPPSTVVDIVRSVLSSVYWHAATEVWRKEEEEAENEEKKAEEILQNQLRQKRWAHWRSNPVNEIWKEKCATIRLISGNEFFVRDETLRKLRTLRNFHRHVRECLHLPNHISLSLTFIGSRIFGREWKEHVVACGDDPNAFRYLQGSVLQAVMHP